MLTPKNQSIICVFFAFVLLSFSTQAQDTDKLSVKNTKYPHPLLVMLDFDEDGFLTFDEFRMAPKFLRSSEENRLSVFQRFDKNQDKLIQPEELPVYFRAIPHKLRPWAANRLSDLDLNGDGYVSKEEFYKAPFISEYPLRKREQIFSNQDLDENGKISATDLLIQRKRNLLNQRDLNQDGKVEFFEYKQASWAIGTEEKYLKELFTNLDSNKNGHIDKKDEFPISILDEEVKLKP